MNNVNVRVSSELPFEVCTFNKKRDVVEVVGGLAIDINAAIRNNAVEDTGTEVSYNGISNPSDVIGRVRDEFDAFDAARVIAKHNKSNSANDATKPAAPSGGGSSDAAAPGAAGAGA